MPTVATPRVSPARPRVPAGGERIRYTVADSSLGLVLVARTDAGLAAVLLGENRQALRRELRQRWPNASCVEDGTALSALAAHVVAHVEAPSTPLDGPVPLDLHGTPFQQLVWQALQRIPPGSTATYTEIAEQIGRPTAARAVAHACAANPVAVLVPCHRVVRSDGSLSGYRWGVGRKRALLDREAARCVPR